MAERFSPARIMGIPRARHEEIWNVDVDNPSVQMPERADLKTTGSKMLFSPQRGYSARPMMATRFDPFAQQFAQFEAMDDLDQLQARKEILANPQALIGQGGADRRAEHVVRGTLSPGQAALLERQDDKAIEGDVAAATAALDAIDPTDAQAWQKLTETLTNAAKTPSVATHPVFRNALGEVRRNILSLKGTRTEAQRDPRTWFAMHGGNPEEFDAGKYADKEGKPDLAKMAYNLAQIKQAKNQRLSAAETKQLEQAAAEIGEISDSRKKAAFKAAHGRDPLSEGDWSLAYKLAEKALMPEREHLAAVIKDLDEAGREVPGRYRQMAGLGTEGSPEAQPQAAPADSIPLVKTPDELLAMKLPSGTKFRTPDGQIRIAK